jgi:hypothetical protein
MAEDEPGIGGGDFVEPISITTPIPIRTMYLIFILLITPSRTDLA